LKPILVRFANETLNNINALTGVDAALNYLGYFFQQGQILFRGFAYFILMIYVKKLELIQIVSMARYL